MSQFGIQIHKKPTRKGAGNGSKKGAGRDRKRFEVGNYFIETKLGSEPKLKIVRARGGNARAKLKHATFANVLTKGGYKKVKIKGVIESKDNRNFARLAIITKGVLIDTELGKAIVTNRAGREGSINAKIVE